MLWAVDVLSRETMLFAAVGFFIGGFDDLAIDLIYFIHQLLRLVRWHGEMPVVADFVAERPGHIAVFVAAWDESAVIGAMLRAALARFEHPDYTLYVGTYPNDRPTIDAVADVAAADSRIRLVIGSEDGPTTKAGCLNAIWWAMLRDEAAGVPPAKAIALHDAEDIVHPAELAIFDQLIDHHWVVQLPVLPLVDRQSPLVSGHYADEFAESHAKQMVVREFLGTGLPLAGVGCAIARPALDLIASFRDGGPFDPTSLTEDYELGLGIDALGGRATFARVAERRGGPVVAVRAYFPGTLEAAVRQKSRWMVGIALAGWDRVGWGRLSDWREHWMRMRDRRGPLAMLVLSIAYLALLAWVASWLLHLAWPGPQPVIGPAMRVLLEINAVLLAWRLVLRIGFTVDAYGWREACWVPLRMLVANMISLRAARLAMIRYWTMLRGGEVHWDKTRHDFPDDIAAALDR